MATNALSVAAALLVAALSQQPPSLTGRWMLTVWPDSASGHRTETITGSLTLEPVRGTPGAYRGRTRIGLPAFNAPSAETGVAAGAGPGDSVRVILNPDGRPRPVLYGVWRLGAVQGRYQAADARQNGRFTLRRVPR